MITLEEMFYQFGEILHDHPERATNPVVVSEGPYRAGDIQRVEAGVEAFPGQESVDVVIIRIEAR